MKSRILSITAAAVLAAAWTMGHETVNAGGVLRKQCNDCNQCGHCARCGRLHCHGECGCGNRRAQQHSGEEWSGNYYHTMWGQPVALIVPPTSELQTHWNWGVAQTSVTPIWPQYSRNYPGPYYGGRGFLPTPRWPSSTDQFGVYYVRGPW